MKDQNGYHVGLLPGLGGPPAAKKVDAESVLNVAQEIEEFMNAKGIRRDTMVEACIVCAAMTVGSTMGLAGAGRKHAVHAWRDLAVSGEPLLGLAYSHGDRERMRAMETSIVDPT